MDAATGKHLPYGQVIASAPTSYAPGVKRNSFVVPEKIVLRDPGVDAYVFVSVHDTDFKTAKSGAVFSVQTSETRTKLWEGTKGGTVPTSVSVFPFTGHDADRTVQFNVDFALAGKRYAIAYYALRLVDGVPTEVPLNEILADKPVTYETSENRSFPTSFDVQIQLREYDHKYRLFIAVIDLDHCRGAVGAMEYEKPSKAARPASD